MKVKEIFWFGGYYGLKDIDFANRYMLRQGTVPTLYRSGMSAGMLIYNS